MPPCVTAQTARSNTGPCGTNSSTVAFGVGMTFLGNPAGSVATTCTGSSASAAIAQSELTALGALKSVTFESVNQAGAEIYRTDFERGALEWAFSVNAQGLIANAIYRRATTAPP